MTKLTFLIISSLIALTSFLFVINNKDKELDLNAIYYVATSDYLANGGDNMRFFLTNEGVFDLDYKIRNILIDYFKEVNTVEASSVPRIIINPN